ncbi:sensor histidine kinase [Actinoallomurus bryophytorum]|uniref:sensor histidine kinase n=1 Tax=Actinoallomurus bryophytorum TaxID=1490222 RepID=UPI001FE2B14B|nr:histidine kinase [Actinoallomurus bryophytorum]
MSRLGRRSDLALGVIVGVVVFAGTVFHTRGLHVADIKAYAMIALGAAALAAQRRFPVPAVNVAAISTAFYYIGPFPDGPEMITFAIASFLAAARGQRLAAYTGSAAGLAVFGWAEFLVGPTDADRFAGVLAWVLVVLFAGEVSRYHRAYLGESKRRADEAERTREEEFRRRATEERLRIARELHDVLAHKISLINVQAGAALHRRQPDQAYAALGAIKDASKETLRELRATLGVLRQVDEAQPLSPAPSLDHLDELITRTNDAGLPVRFTVSGDRADLPAPVDLAAYRIVQEALTNAVRHAGPATATVLVRYNPDHVVVEVGDDGAGAETSDGNGIRGMRERAATLGGTLAAGPRPGGGFLVRASLPLRTVMSE